MQQQFIPQVSKVQNVADVEVSGLGRLQTNAQDVMAKAMELTDAWGQAMFIMDRPLVESLFAAIGFSRAVCAGVFDAVRSLAYVQHRQQDAAPQTEVTWHAMDATCMTLRGIEGLKSAMTGITDTNVEKFLEGNIDLFETLMKAMPDYTRNLMFSPGIAADVLACFGARISPETLYDLAWRYGRQVTKDLDGRLGISTQFIRSLSLTIAARI
ncbi:MAG TPA: hypothetical protein VNM90_19865 [Haliangium sp.]|nr:hypothetical protein [Haliangium sp.]